MTRLGLTLVLCGLAVAGPAAAEQPPSSTPPSPPPSAAPPEDGSPEAGSPEAGPPEAGSPEAGSPEAGSSAEPTVLPVAATALAIEPVAATRAPARRGADLAVNRPLTGAFIVGGALIWAGSDRVFQDTLAPKDCRIFCEPEVNPFDRELSEALTWDDDELPQVLSDAAAYVAIPVVGLGGLAYAALTEGRSKGDLLDDVLVVAETTVVVGLINRATALSFGRTRPRTRNAPIDDPVRDSRQAHESFFSGHTSAAFSVGVAAAQVASLRGYRIAPWLWGSAFVFGATTGYMRLAGADHYPTDVLVGATVATVVGVLWPRLHVRKAAVRVEPLALADGGGGLRLRGAW